MNDDLIARLRALARAEHSDLSVADEAADLIDALLGRVARFWIERNEARNERLSDDGVGYVCATCGDPVESEPCPDHSPVSWA